MTLVDMFDETPFYVVVIMPFTFCLLACLISGLLYICMLCIEQYGENRDLENREKQISVEMFTPMRRPIPNPFFHQVYPV
ncbi:unnamed protein product [Caenorhabditis nigoni]